jgi:hypothetical protein
MPKNKGDPALFKKTRRSKVGKKRNAQRSIDTLVEQNLARHQYHGKFVTKKGRINALSVPIKYTDEAGVEIIRGRQSNGIVGRRNTQPVFDFLAQAGAGLGVPHPQQANPPPAAPGAPRIPPVAQPIIGGNPAFQGGHWRPFGRQPAGRGANPNFIPGNAVANNNLPLGLNNNLGGGFLPAAPLGGGYMGANLVAAANANPPPPPPRFLPNAAGFGSIQPADMRVPNAAYLEGGLERGGRAAARFANVIPASPGEGPLVNAKGWGDLNVDERLHVDEQAQPQLAFQYQAPNARPARGPRNLNPNLFLNTPGIDLNLNAIAPRNRNRVSPPKDAIQELLPPGIGMPDEMGNTFEIVAPVNTQVQALFGQLANDQVQQAVAQDQAAIQADQARANAMLASGIPLLANNDHKRRFDNFRERRREAKAFKNLAIENAGAQLSNRMAEDNIPQVDQSNPYQTPDRPMFPSGLGFGPVPPPPMNISPPFIPDPKARMMEIEEDIAKLRELTRRQKERDLENETKKNEVEDQRLMGRMRDRRAQEEQFGIVRPSSTASDAERAAYAAFFKDRIDDRDIYYADAMKRLNDRIGAPLNDGSMNDLTEPQKQEVLAQMAKMLREFTDITRMVDAHKDLTKQTLQQIMANTEPPSMINTRISDVKEASGLEGGLFIRLNRFRLMVDEYEQLWQARAAEQAAARHQATLLRITDRIRNDTANGQETAGERALVVRDEVKENDQLPNYQFVPGVGRVGPMLDLGPNLTIMHDPANPYQFQTPPPRHKGDAPPNPPKAKADVKMKQAKAATAASPKAMPGRSTVKEKTQKKMHEQQTTSMADIRAREGKKLKMKKINTVRVGQIGQKVNVEKVQEVELSDRQARAAARLLAENQKAAKK